MMMRQEHVPGGYGEIIRKEDDANEWGKGTKNEDKKSLSGKNIRDLDEVRWWCKMEMQEN